MATRAIDSSAAADTRTFRVQRRYECELEYALFLFAAARLGVDAGGISVVVHRRTHGVFLALGAAFKLATRAVSRVGIVCVSSECRYRFAQRAVFWADLGMRRNRFADGSLKAHCQWK